MILAPYTPYLLYIIPVISISVYSVTYSIVFNHKVVTGLGNFCDMAPGMGGFFFVALRGSPNENFRNIKAIVFKLAYAKIN